MECIIYHLVSTNRIGCVMIMLASSVVDCGFESRSS